MLFASVYPYALIKVARALGELKGGPEAEYAIIEREMAALDRSAWPCFQTLGELLHVEPAIVVKDASGSIAGCRSRMAGRFLMMTDCDVWLSIDDDIFASREVLSRVIETARSSREIATVPYLLRDGRTASVSGLRRNTVGFRGDTTGMGLVAMHREAVGRVATTVFSAKDSSGMSYPTLYLEYIEGGSGGSWLGEDIAFCRRAYAAHVPIHVLANAPICHAGRWSRLGDDGAFAVDPQTAGAIAG